MTSKHRKQLTLAVSDFERYRKPTRREKFLAEMDSVVPWKELAALIEPFYPKSTSAGGRPAFGLERMLRIHCPGLQSRDFIVIGAGSAGLQCYNDVGLPVRAVPQCEIEL